MDRELVIRIIRVGIGKECNIYSAISDVQDWDEVKVFAFNQGLSAVVLDGIDRMTKVATTLPASLKLEWIGDVLQNYEQRYLAYEKAISSLASFYDQHGFKMMLLKGYACALDWPIPKHRPCGDIDIWLFGQQKAADKELDSWLKVNGSRSAIDTSHHHHTTFEWNGFLVENHYDFVNTKDMKSSKKIEKIFKELGVDDSHYVVINNEKVYIPSPNLHALFLMRHLVAHFASVSITLRQVLDWAFFVEKHTKEIDWEWLTKVLREYHMYDFYNIINAICVGDLGFDFKFFPSVQFDPNMKNKVLNDIMFPKYSANEPLHLIPRLLYKYRRWQGNAWKQELCYSESRWSAFWSGLWAHLLKPASL